MLLSREERFEPKREPTIEDRVRLTWLGGSQYGLSARTWTGRWEKLPFTGTPEELLDVLDRMLFHLIAPLTADPEGDRPRAE